MNTEGFAFAAWIRLHIIRDGWRAENHGWHCSTCREVWTHYRTSKS